jgi:methionine--tRNA ligase beta chain
MLKNYLKNSLTLNLNVFKSARRFDALRSNVYFSLIKNKNFTEKKKSEEGKTLLFKDCELRVGKVVDIQDMEDSEDIYYLKVDFGDTIRDVGTGLRKHLPHSEFKGRNVIVFCNLKPKKLGLFVSNGMILCAYNVNRTNYELLRPSESKYQKFII